ncbi:MAG: fatty acid desaturase [Maricaulis sp.]|uniref:fatty acid desaturase n=1 Tax=Maricaulis sp. TaxID=1486257 RepID=UPI001B0C7719|nr:fatty acid desaturase [Maricaulis sp.]MBO6696940.1 fatty acid desaturase [Henriciella sp.]MBO6729079.1 fatty acid desaturase [Maricaulis sp.]MBO6878353.1 fatty acid desaturase [Maricaulis sp.]
MDHSASTAIHADDPELFKVLIQRPGIAWPTLMLLAFAYAILGFSICAYVAGTLPLVWAMALNVMASYMAFTVAHDATHSAVSTNKIVNDWIGRAGILLLEPGPFFQVFRFIHMQHHKFTNDHEKDPDTYCGRGPAWLFPLRWLTIDFVYFRSYLNAESFRRRPGAERAEFFLSLLFAVIMVATVAFLGWLGQYLLLFFIPTRIAKFLIVIAFDFLPHYPHEVTAKEDRYRSTSNRVGLEWLMTPLFLSQNYHLVHHLYPAVPFYRYLKIWNARRAYHESKAPAITDIFALSARNTAPGPESGVP